ncbi:DEKNAAC100433 [Brettanomyces naardenensis]|uniref:DEKNAAC100433 n=1 Tax=Brettanomyces naardenensis TaxID=13370 RepID=A0A448YEL4_BRENA|nr:DEKNAAC100433 [Brettanomyces naardenensis]
MSDISTLGQLLAKSLQPATAKEAEVGLKGIEGQQGFPLSLLHLIDSDKTDPSVRLAAALYFKNLIKRKWIDETGHYQLHSQDIATIKQEIVSLMIRLPDHLQVQIGEAISLIAESEFPELWPGLLDELVARLSPDDMITDKGILKVAHSIFKRWRPLFRSDELFTEIKFVLAKFSQPFLDLLIRVDQLIDQSNEQVSEKQRLTLLFENLLLLIKIYYDLNCQDIPEFFEDHLKQGMAVVHKYLKYTNTLLEDPTEDDEIDLVTDVKISICELIQLYTTRYEEEFHEYIPEFILTVWDLLNNVTAQPKYDILASKGLQFLTAIASTSYATMISDQPALKQITEKIILPNVTLRESDEEMFEDDPIEYTRRDLEGSDSDTRRRAATEFLRALKENSEKVVTQVIMRYINSYLQSFQADPTQWKAKDIAIYLFSAIAAKGSMTNAGVTVTNLLVDVVQFFTTYVAPDLVSKDAHPILKVDAIKYIFIFRNQLTKPQLTEAFPLLSAHFEDDNYVVYTYAAITVEKILSLRDPSNHQRLLFDKNDIPPTVSKGLLMNLFRLMFKKGDTPEKLAENEFLMKCVMRVLLTAEDSLQDATSELLQQLLKVIQIISKNPSNPKFSHYTFESLCVILKSNAANVEVTFQIIKPTMLGLLSQEIQEFIPYTFQILSYCLEIYPKGRPMPEEYAQLVKPLCSPAVWEFRGNISAIARLLSAIVKFSPSLFYDGTHLTPILGVFQKLISSKVNDHLGFELLETILLSIDIQYLQQYLKQIGIIIMSRLQNYRTEKFIKRFIIFLCWLSCLPASRDIENKNHLNSQFAVSFLENVQPGLFGQVLDNFITPHISTFNNLQDKKILIIGMTNLLVENLNSGSVDAQKLISGLGEALKLLMSDSIKNYMNIDENLEILLDLENDEMTFGSSYNQLNIIQTRPSDPVRQIANKDMILQYVKAKLSGFGGFGELLPALQNSNDPELVDALKRLGFVN